MGNHIKEGNKFNTRNLDNSLTKLKKWAIKKGKSRQKNEAVGVKSEAEMKKVGVLFVLVVAFLALLSGN